MLLADPHLVQAIQSYRGEEFIQWLHEQKIPVRLLLSFTPSVSRFTFLS